MPSGQIETVGYAAHNGWEYQGIVQKLVADGKLSDKNINLKAMIDYFQAHPDEIDRYVNRNPRFVFFQSGQGDPRGSLNEPVIPFRTIATDKTIYPRAMFAFVSAALNRSVGFALDQDTGGAIRAAGRCDVYMGVGDHAGELAGGTYREGRLYYLFIKPDMTDCQRRQECGNQQEDRMAEGATIGHIGVKVKDINGMIKMIEDLLGFHVSRKKGDGEIPSSVWFEEGLQLVHDPDFGGPEGRLHHLAILVSDRDAMAQECKRRGFSRGAP